MNTARKILFLSTFLMFFLACTIKAQLNWRETSPIFGGDVLAFCVNKNGDLFASTKRGLFLSKDKGGTWLLQSDNNIFTKFFVHSSGRVFGLRYGYAVELLDDGKRMKSLAVGYINGISQSPNGNMYITTNYNSGIYVSKDTAETWQKLPFADSSNVFGVFVDKNENIFVSTPNKIYKSPDGGNSWFLISNDLQYVFDFLQTPDGTLFFFSNYGYIKSTDDGLTWQKLSMNTQYSINSAQLLPNGEILVLTPGAFFISKNHVTDWDRISYSNYFFDTVLYTGNQFLFGIRGRGIFVYDSAKNQWVERNQGLISNFDNFVINKRGILFSSSGDFVYSSADLGRTWKRVLDEYHYKFFSDGVDSSVFTISDSKILYTNDNGETWKEINVTNPIGTISDAAISPDNVFYIAKGEKLYISRDFGNTWKLIWKIEKQVDHFANTATYLRPGPNGEINFVFAKQCFRSFDYGKHWQITAAKDLPLPYTDEGKTLLLFKRSPWGNLYAVIWNQLYTVSATGCWSMFHDFGVTEYQTPSFVWDYNFSNNGQMFLIAFDKLLTSSNHGETWETMAQGSRFSQATIEIFDKYIFINNNRSLLYSEHSPKTVASESKSKVSNSYPNPFNNQTTIEFYLQQPGDVNLSIFNSIGQKIETLAQSYTGAGFYKINWQPKNLASGIYFYRLQTPSIVETKKMIYMK